MKNNLNYTGQIVALLSFVIGTCLIAFYLYLGENYISLGFAISMVVITIIVNSILFITITIAAIFKRINQNEALKTCGLMLLNIPISILYFYMVIMFPNQNFL
ncbi:hypothetical protein [Psychroserpens sp.]|uniref:hypothetical protein n=1 Tax=Psychroserpens sp. TaxID=2020870 RepID=UPI00385A39B6